MRNYLTIDVEDYYHVSAFEDIVEKESWGLFESRVERNTAHILDLFSQHNVRATFFVLGWVAEKYPALVKAINEQGHEIGCHSYWHRRVYDLTPDEFKEDTLKAKQLLEDITTKPVVGYRAPSYSITKDSLWAFDILEELGFQYDSSVFPIYHDSYGIPDSPRFAYKIQGLNLMEFPMATALFFGKKFPVAGGGYFRLFPYWFIRKGLMSINNKENKPFNFYLHPWEIDPDQPRFKKARFLSNFRHYNNLEKTEHRFQSLLQDFTFQPLSSFF